MTSVAWVRGSAESLEEAVKAEDWNKADRALQYFIGAWQRARVRGEDSAMLASWVDALRIKVVGDHDVSQQVGPTQFAWMLAGISSVLTQAVTPAEPTGQGIEGRILAALEANGKPMATAELAKRIDRSVETTARALPRLRALGLTTGQAAGRQMLNSITPTGRARIEQLRSERPEVDMVEKDWFDARARSSDARPEHIGLRSNDIEALRRRRA